jgi:glutamate-1-semialdehyde 2,1-aminomutase
MAACEMPSGWAMTDADRALAAELQGRLPPRMFDVHAHLYRAQDFHTCPASVQDGPPVAGIEVWRESMEEMLGRGRLEGAMLTPFPYLGTDPDAINRFVAAELGTKPAFRATMVVTPAMSRESAETFLADPGIVGFKPYHVYGSRARTFDCDLSEFLPEWAWALAHERGLVILLHMVKDGALADPENQRAIREFSEKYPRAKLILAHAARGFHWPNTARAITSLRGLHNVWFDTSAICEAEPLQAILDEFGPRRLMWGSDFPISRMRGRCVTLGSGFAWITTDQVRWNDKAFFGQPLLVGLESLRALLAAVDAMGLDAADMQDICADNARRLLGLAGEPSNRTQALYADAKKRIPGGTQLLSKRPEMMAPEQWPAYFREARGCEVWDLDGRHFYDLSTHGIGACLLGFRDPEVTRAVRRRVLLGSYCTLNPPEEVELAERLCEIHPWAEKARFVRSGGEMMSVAVRIARATTDRSAVAICGYHGWHDWYLAANLGESDALRGHLLPGLNPLGVPRELRGTAFTFTYGNRGEFDKVISEHGHRLAAVVMEPCRLHDPVPGFLEHVRDEAHRVGALLIFDEITIGWRLILGGAHRRFGVNPDMAVFAKSLGNGHPMAAVIGTQAAMEGAHTSFISSAYWTESVGPAAALAAVRKMEAVDVPAHCARIGLRIQEAWREAAARHRLPVKVPDTYPALAQFAFQHELSQELKTLYVQGMLQRGFLGSTLFYVTLAHTEEIVTAYIRAIDEVFAEMAEALARGNVKERLKGPAAHTGFRRLL